MLGLGVGALAGLTIIAFDLAADPHEQRDLLATVPPATLLAWRAQVVAGTALQFAAVP
jgi:hypothetical protein